MRLIYQSALTICMELGSAANLGMSIACHTGSSSSFLVLYVVQLAFGLSHGCGQVILLEICLASKLVMKAVYSIVVVLLACFPAAIRSDVMVPTMDRLKAPVQDEVGASLVAHPVCSVLVMKVFVGVGHEVIELLGLGLKV